MGGGAVEWPAARRDDLQPRVGHVDVQRRTGQRHDRRPARLEQCARHLLHVAREPEAQPVRGRACATFSSAPKSLLPARPLPLTDRLLFVARRRL